MSHLESAHVVKQVGVVPRVHAHEGVVPLDRGDRSREPVLDVPERCASQVHIVLQHGNKIIDASNIRGETHNNVKIEMIFFRSSPDKEIVPGITVGSSSST